MMQFFNLVANKKFMEAEKLLNKTITSNPFIPQLYDQKIELNRKMYWNKLITNEELEKRVKIIKDQVEELRIPAKQPALTTLKL